MLAISRSWMTVCVGDDWGGERRGMRVRRKQRTRRRTCLVSVYGEGLFLENEPLCLPEPAGKAVLLYACAAAPDDQGGRKVIGGISARGDAADAPVGIIIGRGRSE